MTMNRLKKLEKILEGLTEQEFERFTDFIESYVVLDPEEGDSVVFRQGYQNKMQVSSTNRNLHPVYCNDDCVVPSTLAPNKDWHIVVHNPKIKSSGYL